MGEMGPPKRALRIGLPPRRGSPSLTSRGGRGPYVPVVTRASPGSIELGWALPTRVDMARWGKRPLRMAQGWLREGSGWLREGSGWLRMAQDGSGWGGSSDRLDRPNFTRNFPKVKDSPNKRVCEVPSILTYIGTIFCKNPPKRAKFGALGLEKPEKNAKKSKKTGFPGPHPGGVKKTPKIVRNPMGPSTFF